MIFHFNMKKLNIFRVIVVATLLAVSLNFTPADAYCSGWNEGYKFGYCYQKQFCTVPYNIPTCPLVLNNATYENGYQAGFLRGVRDGSR